MLRIRLIQLAAATATLLTLTPARATYYSWFASCTSENWHACCEDAAGHHNNWWPGPYVMCPGFPASADDVEVGGSAVYLVSSADVWSFHSSGVFKLYDSGLSVHTAATFDGPFEWNAGSLATGVFNINYTANLATTGRKQLAAARLNIVGVASITADEIVDMDNHALIDIAPGGLFEIQTVSSIHDTPGTTVSADGIHVRGELRKNLSIGTLDISVPLNNDGLVKVLTGTLSLQNAYGDSSGIFDLAATTVLDCKSYKMSAGTTITGDGLVRLPYLGILLVDAGATIDIKNLELDSVSQRRGAGHIRVTSAFNWLGGALGAPGVGTTSILPGATMTISGPDYKLLGSHTLNNAGAAVWTGDGPLNITGTESAPIFNNQATGAFDIQTDADMSAICCGYEGIINNAGLLKKSAGAGVTDIFPSVNNTGTVEARSGTINFYTEFTQTAGRTRLLGGAITGNSTFTLDGGTLEGSGLLGQRFTNSGGEVSPGLSPGSITFDGYPGYVQNAGGSLKIEIGGHTPGSEHDKILVTNFAYPGGTLKLSLINGFVPAAGDTFVILHAYGVFGTFDSVTLTGFPTGMDVEVLYTYNDITVHILSSAVPSCSGCAGDLNTDGRVNGKDISTFTGCLVSGTLSASCACADMNSDYVLSGVDASMLVTKLITDVDTLCP